MNTPFPAYRSRYLPAMTLAQIAALPDKATAPVILATGAIEQHGPHLPVAVDALMGQVWLTRALEKLPAEIGCYVAPPVTVGKSNEHTGYPGTLMISKQTLRAQLLAVAGQLHAWGFKRLGILNTHGGNSAVLDYTLREIEVAFGLEVRRLRSGAKFEVSAQEAAYGFHAGEIEASWIYAVAGQHCDPAAAACEFPARIEDPGELRPEAAPAVFSWATRDLSVSGIMGDATIATAEKGARWIEAGAAGYAKAITEWSGTK